MSHHHCQFNQVWRDFMAPEWARSSYTVHKLRGFKLPNIRQCTCAMICVLSTVQDRARIQTNSSCTIISEQIPLVCRDFTLSSSLFYFPSGHDNTHTQKWRVERGVLILSLLLLDLAPSSLFAFASVALLLLRLAVLQPQTSQNNTRQNPRKNREYD
jgi:hypothetical protein